MSELGFCSLSTQSCHSSSLLLPRLLHCRPMYSSSQKTCLSSPGRGRQAAPNVSLIFPTIIRSPSASSTSRRAANASPTSSCLCSPQEETWLFRLKLSKLLASLAAVPAPHLTKTDLKELNFCHLYCISALARARSRPCLSSCSTAAFSSG